MPRHAAVAVPAASTTLALAVAVGLVGSTAAVVAQAVPWQFVARTPVAVILAFSIESAAADFDGDGDVDVFVCSQRSRRIAAARAPQRR